MQVFTTWQENVLSLINRSFNLFVYLLVTLEAGIS